LAFQSAVVRTPLGSSWEDLTATKLLDRSLLRDEEAAADAPANLAAVVVREAGAVADAPRPRLLLLRE
jgi:hypothetical protein